ncbi:MAG: AAA family ATPase [Planctomycetota bacterium]
MSTDLQSTTATISNHALPPNAQLTHSFVPFSPKNLHESGLQDYEVEALILKALHARGAATSRQLADQIKLPGEIIRNCLDRLRAELLVVHRGTSDLVDFVFQLTEGGVQRTGLYLAKNSYCGSAPVPVEKYIDSVNQQTVASKVIRLEDFRRALSGLFLTTETQSQLAQAVNSGRGVFLYGPAGNGKTSVACQLMKCYRDFVWIPRAISVGGDIIRLYDSSVHQDVGAARAGIETDKVEVDPRWVLIERPTVVVGGELMMEHLELQLKTGTGVFEAPVQLKSNLGTLVIDDFGRQRVSPTDILNRWIVPLERRVDFLMTPSGRQLQLPFEQILVLATNLEPTELVDEAFLRRIPYKIELTDPNEQSLQAVFVKVAEKLGLKVEAGSFEHLLEKQYHGTGTPMRYCHPRDLLFQVKNLCELHGLPKVVTPKTLNAVTRNNKSRGWQ